MTWGFVASFGGVVLAIGVLVLWEHLEIRAAQKRANRVAARRPDLRGEAGEGSLDSVVAKITEAEQASRQTADDLAAIRQQLSTR